MEDDFKDFKIRCWSASECEAMIKADPHKFIEAKRQEFAIGSHRAIYNLMQGAAHLTLEIDCNAKLKEELLKQEPHVSRHKKPTTNAALAMQKLTHAFDENSSSSANKKAKALHGMLKKGLSPEAIAKQLSERGGVAGALRLLANAQKRMDSPAALKREDDDPSVGSEEQEEQEDQEADDQDGEDNLKDDKGANKSEEQAKKATGPDRRVDPKPGRNPPKLKAPRPSKGYAYLFVEVPDSKFEEVLGEGVGQMTIDAIRLSETWVRALMVDDDADFDGPWDFDNLKVPAPTEEHHYVYVEVRRSELAALLEETDHDIQYEVTRLASGWMQARVIADYDDQDEGGED